MRVGGFVLALCLLFGAHDLFAANDLSGFFRVEDPQSPPEKESPSFDAPQRAALIRTDSSIYPQPPMAFTPDNPSHHGVWKGRAQLPLAQMHQLCLDLAAYLGFPRENGAHFLLEIAAAESDFGYYVRQVRGPAQSVWQIEPETARDMHARLPKRNPGMYQKILALRDPLLSEEENVVTNLTYGGALCLGILYLKGIRFETLTSLSARANAWKRYYNTYLGKGTFEGYCQKALRYVGLVLPKTDLSFDPDAFEYLAERDRVRFQTLPDNFDQSPMGRHYATILAKDPHIFAELPPVVFQAPHIQHLADNLLWELIRKVQKNPEVLRDWHDLPPEILRPLVLAGMAENALRCYPHLPAAYQEDPLIVKMYEAQKHLRERMR
ncbi:MAG: hypothetical protein IJS54_04260 [Desulfovibrio sp.]|nr:hypothetical protein [Desulfovibrio sp.]